MPVMSGEETQAEIRKTHPAVPVIISTGFSEAQAILHFGGQKVSGFLQKPFTARQLGEAVKAILQQDRT